MDEKSYRELLDIASRSYVVSLDDVLALEDGDIQREETVRDDSLGALDILEQEEEVEFVLKALQELPEREY